MCHVAAVAAASTAGRSTTPSPSAAAREAASAVAVLHVEQRNTIAERAHEIDGIAAADLRPVDVDLRDHVGFAELVEDLEPGAAVEVGAELPGVVVVADAHPAARARARRRG